MILELKTRDKGIAEASLQCHGDEGQREPEALRSSWLDHFDSLVQVGTTAY